LRHGWTRCDADGERRGERGALQGPAEAPIY